MSFLNTFCAASFLVKGRSIAAVAAAQPLFNCVYSGSSNRLSISARKWAFNQIHFRRTTVCSLRYTILLLLLFYVPFSRLLYAASSLLFPSVRFRSVIICSPIRTTAFTRPPIYRTPTTNTTHRLADNIRWSQEGGLCRFLFHPVDVIIQRFNL